MLFTDQQNTEGILHVASEQSLLIINNHDDMNDNDRPKHNNRKHGSADKKPSSLPLSLLLKFSLYSFFHMVNPQQPFLVEFLSTKGIPFQTVLFDIFPVWTYAMPFVQILIGIMSEQKFIGHKWIITMGVISALIFMLSELFSTKDTVWMLQLTEVAVAFMYGTDHTYFALLYHSSASSSYQFLVLGAVIGQTMYFCGQPIQYMYYVGFGSLVPCFILSLLFPSPKQYVHKMRDEEPSLQQNETDSTESTKSRFLNILSHFWKQKVCEFAKDIINCYKNFSVLFWSLYSIVGIATHMLVLTYYQTFFKTLNSQFSLNGVLIAMAYVCAGFVSMIPTRLGRWVSKWQGKAMAIVICGLCGICLLLMSVGGRCPIFAAYALFIVYHCLFEFLYVVSFTQIAKSMKLTRFAAIFSFNSAMANIFQVFVQLLVGKQFLALNSIGQFTAFGGVMISLAFLLLLSCIVHAVVMKGPFVKNEKVNQNNLDPQQDASPVH